MKRWAGGLLLTVSAISLLVLAWEPDRGNWPGLLTTAVISLLVGAGLLGSDGMDEEKRGG